MIDAPPDLVHRLRRHGQDHLLADWAQLEPDQRRQFVEQLAGIDLAEMEALFRRRDEPHMALPTRDRIAPLPVEDRDTLPTSSKARGESALRDGQVAVLVVAGGQGSRLGFEKPKGMYPVGPLTQSTLFQLHAEKVLALSRRYHTAIPFLVMTSPATHSDTEDYFREHSYFGLKPQQVVFFQQGTMPALDRQSGRMLLESPGQLFLSPNGHGGTLTALADSGLLADLKGRGIETIFYFQVDNPLVQIADPVFIGRHCETESDVSSKVVDKQEPGEKVGILALIDGKCGIIEYSDMPPEMTAEREASGRLTFRAGNPAIHAFSVRFLERVTRGAGRLQYHVARKKVPHYDPLTHKQVTPTTENALKFEMFVFDALPLAERSLAVGIRREDEFAPLKNATGADSPESVRAAQIERARRWLTQAGIAAPLEHDVEVRPLFALDGEELAAKRSSVPVITGPTILG